MSFAEILGRCTFPAPGEPLVCGVSGGPDSLALLVLAAGAGCRVTAVHVDHGLRPGSAREADVVAVAAARVGADFRSERAEVAAGPNLEARARHARRSLLGEDAATGHTADDQAETVLINLLRGGGLDGMAGMRSGPRHPILALRRSETEAVCRTAGLEPVRDPSNDDPRHLRNRIRHEVLPLLCEVSGRDLVPVLARQAGIAGEEAALLDALAAPIPVEQARDLATAPTPLGRRRVRTWLRQAGARPPYPPDLATVERVLAVARLERAATDIGGGLEIRRSGGRLAVRRLVAES